MLPSSEYAELSVWSGRLTVRSRASIHYLSGEFDVLALDFFEDAIMSRLDGDDPVVLDLSELTFMDSSGFYAIVHLAERLGYPSLVIRNPSPAAARVLELTRVEMYPAYRSSAPSGRRETAGETDGSPARLRGHRDSG